MSQASRVSLPDINDHAEAGEISWQRYCHIAQTLDVGELIDTVCREVQGDSGDSPLVHLIAGWLDNPRQSFRYIYGLLSRPYSPASRLWRW
jgi:hypothetical protein